MSNVVVIGDRRKFISCLLTLRVIVDPETEAPTDKLDRAATEFCAAKGSKAKTVQDIRG